MNHSHTLKDLADAVLIDGTADPLSAYDTICRIITEAEQQKARLKPVAMTEITKHGKNGVVLDGMRYSVRSTGAKWKYDHIEAHVEAVADVKRIEAKAKAAYQAMQNGIENMADADGEVVPPAQYIPGPETIFAEQVKEAKK